MNNRPHHHLPGDGGCLGGAGLNLDLVGGLQRSECLAVAHGCRDIQFIPAPANIHGAPQGRAIIDLIHQVGFHQGVAG